MRILIAGGTGTAGRVLARRAGAAGHHVRILTRGPGGAGAGPPGGPVCGDPVCGDLVCGDLVSGSGLDAAVAGVDAVVDLSNIDTARYAPAAAFFRTATEHLFAAERRAGVGHHLTLSIAGVDEFPSAYYRAKTDQEAAVAAASAATGVGHTVARVTQFHDFAATVLRRFRVGPLVLAPALRLQPVHLDDVADHLLELLAAGPAGRAPDLAGPRPEELPGMVRRYARARGEAVTVLPVPLVGSWRRADGRGALRPSAAARGTLDFARWLTEVPTCSPPSNRA